MAQDKRDRFFYGWIAAALVVPLGLVAFFNAMPKPQPRQLTPEEARAEELASRAYALCAMGEHDVKVRLKVPSTATFENCMRADWGVRDNGTVFVRFTVNAQNEFGAMLAKRYRVWETKPGGAIQLVEVSQ